MSKNLSVFRAALISLSISFFAGCTSQPAQNTTGSLFIIGGGARSPALIRTMVETAGMDTHDYTVVLSMASGEPDTAFRYIAKQLNAASPHAVHHFNFDSTSVNNREKVDSLRRARLIYITGGDQNRFMQVVKNTPVYAAIHAAYANGATIAGTSAGAAVMSKHMISGRQLRGDTVYRTTFDKVWSDNIQFEEGLGLLETVIIDQHFIKRSRYSRLLSALADYPDHTCIGIDESTAIIVQGNRIKVTGDSQVVVLSNPESLKSRNDTLITFDDMKFGMYADGDEIWME